MAVIRGQYGVKKYLGSKREGVGTSIHRIDSSKCDKQRQHAMRLVDPIHTERGVVHDSSCVLPTIYQMREDISSIVVTTEAL